MNCPACRAERVRGITYSYIEHGKRAVAWQSNWVACTSCGNNLLAQVQPDELAKLEPEAIARRAKPYTPLYARVLPIVSLGTFCIPVVPFVLAAVAVTINRKRRLWGGLSWGALILSLPAQLLFLYVLTFPPTADAQRRNPIRTGPPAEIQTAPVPSSPPASRPPAPTPQQPINPSAARTKSPGWTLDVSAMATPNDPAGGTIKGQPFVVESVVFDKGALILRQGTGAVPEKAVSIGLNAKQPADLVGKKLSFTPQTARRPRVQLQFMRDPSANIPFGYAMKLEFGQIDDGKLPGSIYLCTPEPNKGVVAGTFVINLR